MLDGLASMKGDHACARQPESVAAVLKVFALLQTLAERGEVGLSELSNCLAMPKATVHRFMQTLVGLGYVRREAGSERYALAMKLFEIGSKALLFPELVDLARRPMQTVANSTGEAVHLGTLIDSEIIYVHKVDSRHLLGMCSKVGLRAPLHCTAIGKVLLAWEHPERRAMILQGAQLTKYRARTIVEPAAFALELERVKVQRFAEDSEEFDGHIRCLGVPIFDKLNRPVAGMSVAFPTFRFDSDRAGDVVTMLTQACRDISVRLGCANFPLDPRDPLK